MVIETTGVKVIKIPKVILFIFGYLYDNKVKLFFSLSSVAYISYVCIYVC